MILEYMHYGLWLILLVVTYLFLKRVMDKEKVKVKLKSQIIEARLEALQAQMNPHFIFNALNSIQNYIIDNKVDDALMYMGDFSHLIRQTIDSSIQSFITLSEEIKYLETYVKVENIRFDNKIVLKIEANNLDIDNIIIPPMLIQPMIENAITHALHSINKKFKVNVSFSKQDNYIKCHISDNGVISDMNNKEKGSAFHALQAIKERLLILQGHKKEKVVHISTSSKGTVITLLIAYHTASPLSKAQ